jgi:hypothetical protein
MNAGSHQKPLSSPGIETPVIATVDQLSCASASTETYFRAAAAVLAMRSDCSGADMSTALLKRHYGVTGSIATLSSEIERTVEVDTPDGRRCILKTSTRPEAVDSFRFQTSALASLEGGCGASLHLLCCARGAGN